MKKDARGKLVQFSGEINGGAKENQGMILAIDEVIQFFAEHHLSKQVKKYQAKSGVAIVMNPNTGEVYAIANMPQYNPNNYSAYKPKRWINGAVSNSYEPGSIFKPILAAAVIDAGLARPHDIFFCENGEFEIGGKKIGEAANHKFGWLTLQDVFHRSSQRGHAMAAHHLGKNNFYNYIKNIGLV